VDADQAARMALAVMVPISSQATLTLADRLFVGSTESMQLEENA
jgi:hypothetical protein